MQLDHCKFVQLYDSSHSSVFSFLPEPFFGHTIEKGSYIMGNVTQGMYPLWGGDHPQGNHHLGNWVSFPTLSCRNFEQLPSVSLIPEHQIKSTIGQDRHTVTVSCLNTKLLKRSLEICDISVDCCSWNMENIFWNKILNDVKQNVLFFLGMTREYWSKT